MASIPGFKNHVFISYAQYDNVSISGEPGWVDSLHLALINAFKRDGQELKVWRDPYLDGSHVVEKELAEQVYNSAILLSIISPNYLESPWCKKEREAFCLSTQKRGGLQVGTRSRLIRAMISNEPYQTLPDELQETLGFDFFTTNPFTPKTILLSPDSNRGKFNSLVEELAQSLQEIISELNACSSSTPPTREKTIYLSEPSPDVKKRYEEVKSTLEQHGYYIMPDQELPAKISASQIEEKVRDYLRRSRLAVHLIGSDYGTIPPRSNDRSLGRIQHEIAVELCRADSDYKSILWLVPDLIDVEDKQQKFIDDLQKGKDEAGRDFPSGVDLFKGDIEKLKTEVLNVFKKDEEEKKKKDKAKSNHKPSTLRRVYVVCDEPEYDEAAPIRGYIRNEKVEVLQPVGRTRLRNDEEHMELLELADAVMIYYGNMTTDEWSRQHLRILQKLRGLRGKKSLLPQAFYLSAPLTPVKKDFETLEAEIIYGDADFPPPKLVNFIRRVKTGKGVI